MGERIFNEMCAAECVFAGRNSRELSTSSAEPAGSGSVSMEGDGALDYIASTGCGISAGHIGAERVEALAPGIRQRIAGCGGPVSREAEVPRKILGLLGLKKTITVKECGAVTKRELLDIAIADRDLTRHI